MIITNTSQYRDKAVRAVVMYAVRRAGVTPASVVVKTAQPGTMRPNFRITYNRAKRRMTIRVCKYGVINALMLVYNIALTLGGQVVADVLTIDEDPIAYAVFIESGKLIDRGQIVVMPHKPVRRAATSFASTR